MIVVVKVIGTDNRDMWHMNRHDLIIITFNECMVMISV